MKNIIHNGKTMLVPVPKQSHQLQNNIVCRIKGYDTPNILNGRKEHRKWSKIERKKIFY